MITRNNILYALKILLICFCAGYLIYQQVTRPKISVVMSTFNRSSLLKRAIESILAQTETDFELIIINDGSTDDTNQILEKYAGYDSRIIVLTNETNKGLPYSLNRGLDCARGTYIARMDDDDASFPNRFEKQVSFLDANPEITATGCSFTFYANNPEQKSSFPSDPDECKVRTFTHVPVVHPCAMIRRSFLEKNNIRYVATYPNAEDMPFWYDVALKHNGLISNLQDTLLLKSGYAPKKENYNQVQQSSISSYRWNAFNYFLKQHEKCNTVCDCFVALEKFGVTKHIIRPEVLQRKIKEVCPKK